ncbi:MAG: hypothetical protein SVW77_02130 [Candidatus Nanohaloarchaea archaeon]|nr:hypothetical protein [Candidatus Nanohaloarchaea archaeon]
MSAVVLALQLGAAVFAVLFVAYYIRILSRAHEAGPEPVSWIAAAVGLALIASFAVLETVVSVYPGDVVVNIQKVYFMLGNLIVAGVLYRLWRSIGGRGGW